MDITYFGFATYVFLLVCACIWLFSKLIRAKKKSKKEENPGYDREQKLFNLYQNIEDMLTSFEEYVEEAKSDTEKSTAKISAMMEETRRLAAEIKAMQPKERSDSSEQSVSEEVAIASKIAAKYPAVVYKNAARLTQNEPVVSRNDVQESVYTQDNVELYTSHVTKLTEPIDIIPRQTAERKNLRTSDRVAQLMDHGLDKNEIARQLGISIREVTLAMKVRKASEVK